jgi:hypothetical protein
VNDPALKVLCKEAQSLMRNFVEFSIAHVDRVRPLHILILSCFFPEFVLYVCFIFFLINIMRFNFHLHYVFVFSGLSVFDLVSGC